MIAAIAGDIVGSVFEWNSYLGRGSKGLDFELFSKTSRITDDSVLTIATADCLLHGKPYAETYQEYGRRFPLAGYGGRFHEWLKGDDLTPYNSFGNGSAMRISPVGWAFDTIEEVLAEAKRSAEVTHSHPEGIKGAQAVAAAIFWARQGKSKDEIREYTARTFAYDMDRTCTGIRQFYQFDVTCQGSVPEAIIAFLDSDDVETAIRLAVSLNGDTDTQACIAGGIAEAFYKEIPSHISEKVYEKLPKSCLGMVEEFCSRYDLPGRYR